LTGRYQGLSVFPMNPKILSAGVLVLLSSSAAIADSKWRVERIDRAGRGCRQTALRLDEQQRVHIAYTSCTDDSCKRNDIAHATRADATSKWVRTMVDPSDSDMGWFTTMEFDDRGGIHIFYNDHEDEELRHAYLGKGTKKWEADTIGKGRGGFWLSSGRSGDKIYVAETKLPSMGYDETSLRVTTLTVGSSMKFKQELADSSYSAGWFTSTAISRDGLPVITSVAGSYPFGALKLVSKRTDGEWDFNVIDSKSTKSSVAVDALGYYHVVYNRYDERNSTSKSAISDFMYATNSPDGQWRQTMVDPGVPEDSDVGYHPAMTIDAHGGIHAVYRDYTNHNLLYAAKAPGGDWVRSTVDLTGEAGLYSSMAADVDGNLHIAYLNGGDLYYGFCKHCAF
jgi:hypothetical protein